MFNLDLFKRSVLGGMMIAIGGTVYLSCEVNYIGAFFFSLGLFTILAFGMKLFTGAIGYAPQKGLVTIWGGNLVGTVVVGLLISATRLSTVVEKAVKVSNVKLSDTPLSIFILSIFCGMAMFIAVDFFKRKGSFLAVFLAVPLFILSGYEHCIANMYYFTVGGAWSIKAVIYLLIMTLGNGVGAIFLYRMTKEKPQ